jgi:hypothetical protein
MQEKFEDTKWVIRSGKSKKDTHHNSQTMIHKTLLTKLKINQPH